MATRGLATLETGARGLEITTKHHRKQCKEAKPQTQLLLLGLGTGIFLQGHREQRTARGSGGRCVRTWVGLSGWHCVPRANTGTQTGGKCRAQSFQPALPGKTIQTCFQVASPGVFPSASLAAGQTASPLILPRACWVPLGSWWGHGSPTCCQACGRDELSDCTSGMQLAGRFGGGIWAGYPSQGTSHSQEKNTALQ